MKAFEKQAKIRTVFFSPWKPEQHFGDFVYFKMSSLALEAKHDNRRLTQETNAPSPINTATRERLRQGLHFSRCLRLVCDILLFQFLTPRHLPTQQPSIGFPGPLLARDSLSDQTLVRSFKNARIYRVGTRFPSLLL